MVNWIEIIETPQMHLDLNGVKHSDILLFLITNDIESTVIGRCIIDNNELTWVTLNGDVVSPIKWALLTPPKINNEITPADFTNKIYPKEGIEIRPTHHFMSRWNSRLGSRSTVHFNAACENQHIRYICRGEDNSFHFLYQDEYGVFYILIVGKTGGIKTILTEYIYMKQGDSVNLSSHKNAFTLHNKQVNIDKPTVTSIINETPAPIIDEEMYKNKISSDASTIHRMKLKIDVLNSERKKTKNIHLDKINKLNIKLKQCNVNIHNKNNDIIKSKCNMYNKFNIKSIILCNIITIIATISITLKLTIW